MMKKDAEDSYGNAYTFLSVEARELKEKLNQCNLILYHCKIILPVMSNAIKTTLVNE
ncbi:hypothetical protein [Chryseobacterium sp. NFX27]|uniref:hypothetical protein n=1 Tax=Chryseobacterium sp. NFX27 TaxID=2819618 RepID=UPI003CEA0B29